MPSRAGANAVDLWYALTADCPADALLGRFGPALSADEHERHARLVHAGDRHVFLLSRALLRLALSKTLGAEAGSFSIELGAGGKPRVAGGVEFNLSHTVDATGAGAAVVAVSRGIAVGVDMEPASRGVELAELVSRRYADAEREMLERCAPGERHRRTVWMWTAKEAVLKATGEGLRRSPESVVIEWGDDGRVRTPGWELARFAAGGYLGSLASTACLGELRATWRSGGELGPASGRAIELLR
ncbi:MAG: 4'-phosphopantetheinyl transferase superfamily protein [Gemmatimonadetes bacterium]|nr:4'-phosphopantetheinyl transferase superfamily protein [Gemmatimonadota bacterium]